jgi:hypothetical protein
LAGDLLGVRYARHRGGRRGVVAAPRQPVTVSSALAPV